MKEKNSLPEASLQQDKKNKPLSTDIADVLSSLGNQKLTFLRKQDNEGYEYIGCTIASAVIRPYLEKLKALLGDEFTAYTTHQALRDMGEHHITLIGPAELKTLGNDSTNIDDSLTYKDLNFVGVGSASDQGNTTYFVVVESPKMNEIRKTLGLNPRDLHITLGFKEKDVFTKPKNRTALIKE